ncbi:MAG: hypothetical protein LCH77_03025 [Actinobacteria bacterium]|nr:hypothetical protein [Actinomycetota bacterium]
MSAAPPKGWGNAGSVRNLLGAAVDAQAERLSQSGFETGDISTLTESDAREALTHLYPQAV